MQPWSSGQRAAQQAAQQSQQNAMRSAQQAARNAMDSGRAAQEAAFGAHQRAQARAGHDFATRSYRQRSGTGGVISGFVNLVKGLLGLGVFAGIVAVAAKLIGIW